MKQYNKYKNPGRGGGKGRFNRNNNNNKNTHTTKKKLTVEDYVYYIGSAKQASDYTLTTDYLINHIKKDFEKGNDIATALRDLEEYDIKSYEPSLDVSSLPETTDAEKEKKKAENRQFEMKYKAKLDQFLKRERVYEDNKYKAYAFVW